MFSILNKLTGRGAPRPNAGRVARRGGGVAGGGVRGGDRSDRGGAAAARSERRCPGRAVAHRAAAPAFGPVDATRTEALKDPIVTAISTVFDPEIPVNIYELGLIYKIEADAESRVHVDMTLTSPACPSAQQLPSEVRYKVKAVEGVSDCTVEVVWEPPWTKEMMSETAKLTLGMF